MVMMLIFAISMILIENRQKDLLQQQLERELHALSSFSLSAVELVSYGFDNSDLDSSFDLLADQIGKASSYRISYFFSDGRMLGDSDLTFEEVLAADNHNNRPEIMLAKQEEFGHSQRFSQTVKNNLVYIAKYDRNTGFIARVSLPANTYKNAIVDLRWSFSVIIVITLAVILAFGLLAVKLNQNAIKKERLLQASRITQRTKQITLIQAMSTMLNSSQSVEDAARLLSTILPQLFPTLNGAIYIGDNDAQETEELLHFGQQWPDNISLLNRPKVQELMLKEYIYSSSEQHLTKRKHYQLSKRELYVSLSNQTKFHGLIYLFSDNKNIPKPTLELIDKATEQISFALCNLKTKERLLNQATRDPLTELYNRRFMLESFEQALNRSERHHLNLTFIMLDLDHFKQFNDNFGHEAGDIVLKAVASVLKENLRLEDIACRYGGEEFCIICPDTNLKDGYTLTEKIRNHIAKLSLNCSGKSLGRVTASFGLSVYPNHADSVNTLISKADKALYRAKDGGRNRSEVSQPIGFAEQSRQ